MNSSALDFVSRLDEQEMEFTVASLDTTKNIIRHKLDIVEVAEKLGIDLRELPRDSEERKEYMFQDIYIGKCPRCNQEDTFRVFRGHQTFGCLSCHWEGVHSNHMDIFQLFRFTDSWNEYDHSYEVDQKYIEQLFKLFPEELAILKGRDLNQYNYAGDCFSTAEKYYPGIEQDLNKLSDQRIFMERELNSMKDYGDNYKKYYQSFHKVREHADRLYYIIEAYKTTSKIYAHREEINEIIHSQSAADVGFENELPDNLLETKSSDPLITSTPDQVEYFSGKLDTSKSVGIYFRTSIDSVLRQDNEDMPLPFSSCSGREETEEKHYTEIPDATFHSHITMPQIEKPEWPEKLPDAIVGNFIIAYSREENNFSIFLSPRHKTEELREFRIRDRFEYREFWESQHEPAFTIEHLVQNISVYGNRFPNSGEENTPVLPDGYREVMTGGWISTKIGMYFAQNENEFSKNKHGETTIFDKNLFYNCIADISGFPVYTDKNRLDFITDYTHKVWRPKLDEAARRRY